METPCRRDSGPVMTSTALRPIRISDDFSNLSSVNNIQDETFFNVNLAVPQPDVNVTLNGGDDRSPSSQRSNTTRKSVTVHVQDGAVMNESSASKTNLTSTGNNELSPKRNSPEARGTGAMDAVAEQQREEIHSELATEAFIEPQNKSIAEKYTEAIAEQETTIREVLSKREALLSETQYVHEHEMTSNQNWLQEVQHKMDEWSERYVSMKAHMSDYIMELTDELEEVNTKYAVAMNKCATLESQNLSLKTNSDTKISKLQLDLSEMTKNCEDFTRSYNLLKTENASLISTHAAEITSRDADIESFKARLVQVEDELSACQLHNKNLNLCVHNLNKTITNDQVTMEKLNNELNETRTEKDKIIKEFKQLSSDLNTSLSSLKELQSDLSVKTAESERLYSEIIALKGVVDSESTRREELQKLAEKRTVQLKHLSRGCEDAHRQFRQMKSELKKLLNDSKELTSIQQSEITRLKSALDDQASCLQNVLDEHNQLLERAQGADEREDRLCFELEELAAQKKVLEKQLASAEKERDRLCHENASVHGHQNAKQKIRYLEKMSAELKEVKAAKAELERTNRHLKLRNKDLETELKKVKGGSVEVLSSKENVSTL